MVYGLLMGLIFLIIISVFGIFLFVRSIKRKSKIGIIISISIGIFVTLCLFINTIDEHTCTNKDVINDLKYVDNELKNNFKIIDNTVSGMPERNQETKLQISSGDRNRIIDKIRHAKNFKLFNNDEEANNDTSFSWTFSDKVLNFKSPEFYSREVYRQIDNIPTRIFVFVADTSNILEYSVYAK